MSDVGIAQLVAREGKKNKAYKDTKGIWTIGVGHTGPEVVEGMVITDQQIYTYMFKDVKWAEDCVNKQVTVPLNQNQFDALCSFVFNVGVGAFTKSTLLKVLNMGNYTEAANQLDRWHIPPEITSRRDSEKAQFLTKE
jgi:lysozyme